MTLEPGTKLGRYEIRAKIGAGGMGEVYLAQDTKLDRKVALKILPADLASNQDRMRRFVQEAKAAAALNHPNIATIHEIGEHDGTHFIAMEFIDGQTLREKIHSEQTELSKLLRYLQHVAEGLAKAHAVGIVHRDLKPDNIMVTRDGHGKILDFGIAKLSERRGDGERGPKGDEEPTVLSPVSRLLPVSPSPDLGTSPGMILGTIGYMSPEQAQGRVNEIDHRSDIFSFGCILFEAVTRHKAFEGRDALDSLHNIVHAPTPQITDLNPLMPDELQRIVRRCLAKDPDKRYQSIREVAIEIEDLRDLVKRDSLHDSTYRTASSPAAPGNLTPDPSTASHAVPGSTQIQSGPASSVSGIKRHRTAVLIGTVVLVVGLLAGGVLLYRRFFSATANFRAANWQHLSARRLTSSGRVTSVALAPDGKFAAYVVHDGGKFSIRLRQTATSNDVEIVAPVESELRSLTFSRDGNYLYYNNQVQNLGTIYQVNALGGSPTKIIADADSGVGLSPDGRQLAFVRDTENGSQLMAANAQGTQPRIVTSANPKQGVFPFINTPAWSPDGKSIALPKIYTSRTPEVWKLVSFGTTDGVEHALSDRDWEYILGVVWLPDGRLMIYGAPKTEGPPSEPQLWLITQGRAPERITNELNDYFGLSATGNGDMVATVAGRRVTNLWLAPAGDAARATQIAPAPYFGEIRWTPDGRLFYTTWEGSRQDMWAMNADGTGARQLTNNASANRRAQMTADGRYIVFISSRSGLEHVWRMDVDGSNERALTGGSGEWSLGLSADGRTVFYCGLDAEGKNAVWQVGIDGGPPTQLIHGVDPYNIAGVTPDGVVVYEYADAQDNYALTIGFAAPGGISAARPLALPRTALSSSPRVGFDGRTINFLDRRDDSSNLWAVPITGGEAKPLTNFKGEQIFSYDWSKDGKQLVVVRGTLISDAVLLSSAQ